MMLDKRLFKKEQMVRLSFYGDPIYSSTGTLRCTNHTKTIWVCPKCGSSIYTVGNTSNFNCNRCGAEPVLRTEKIHDN